MNKQSHRQSAWTALAKVTLAAFLCACGPDGDGALEPSGPGVLTIEIGHEVTNVEIDRQARSFDSTESMVAWLQQMLPVEPLMAGDNSVGVTITDNKPKGTLAVDGRALATAYPLIAMLGGLHGEIEIGGVTKCIDIDQVCDGTLASYFREGAEEDFIESNSINEPGVGLKRSLLSRTFNDCTGPSSDRFCIEGRSERTVINLLIGKRTEHFTKTKITRGGDYNSLAAIYGGFMRSAPDNSIFVRERSNPIREARGPNAEVEFSRSSWTFGVESFETEVFQNCNWHVGHRRLLNPIRFGTEWTRSHRAGLIQCAPRTGSPPTPNYPPPIVLSCNGDITNPVLRCSVTGISPTSSIRWSYSNTARPQFNGRTSISFGCQPGWNYNVTVSGGGRSQSTVARCRATSR